MPLRCLHLNLQKTVLIPLGNMQDRATVLHELRNNCTHLSDCKIENCGKYLGIWLGPGADQKNWDDVILRYQTKAKSWHKICPGLHYTARAYNVFIHSLLSYVEQFFEPTEHVLDLEDKIIRKFVGGPHMWIRTHELQRLRDFLNMPFQFASLKVSALAAKLRMIRAEGLRPAHVQQAIISLAMDEGTLGRNTRAWLCVGMFHDLAHAVDQSESFGCAELDISRSILHQKGDIDDWMVQKLFQREACRMLRGHVLPGNAIHMIIRKLQRWQLRWDCDSHLMRAAHRCHRNFARLLKLVLPRVSSACLATLCNRWCTDRRFQKLSDSSRCVFSCGSSTDSLEHYCSCTRLTPLTEGICRLAPLRWKGMGNWTFAFATEDVSDSELTRLAIVIYTAYSAHNALRDSVTTFVAENELNRMFRSMVTQAVERHSSQKCLFN